MHQVFAKTAGLSTSPKAPRDPTCGRVSTAGKFFSAAGEKFFIKGVTYGTFSPGPSGVEYDPDKVAADFRQMAENGFNCVRLYTVPPAWLLDAAQAHGLRLLIGLPWEQHITFLDEASRARSIIDRVRDGVRSCAGHPA